MELCTLIDVILCCVALIGKQVVWKYSFVRLILEGASVCKSTESRSKIILFTSVRYGVEITVII